MITQETAAAVWNAYREIETGKKLLEDIAAEQKWHHDKTAPSLKDAFGHKQHFQLGIPSGQNSHRLLTVHPQLALSVIRAHIANKEAELAEANERARIELIGPVTPSTSQEQPPSTPQA